MEVTKMPGTPVRCGVCRRRNWQRGGDGRAEIVGSVQSAGSYVLVWQIAPRHGRRAGLPSPKMRAKYGGDHGFAERRDPEKLGFIGDAAGWQWQCHRKHRLRFDEAAVRRQLERHDTIYLDAA